MRYFAPLIAILAFVVGAAAHAQEVADTTVSAKGWVDVFQPFVLLLATSIAGWLATRVTDYLNTKKIIDQDAEERAAFQSSVRGAAGLLVQRLGRDAASAIVDLHDPNLKAMHDYVQKGAKGAFKRWGITPEKTSETIMAELGKLLTGGTVEVAPLSDPIIRTTSQGGSF